MVVIVVDGAAVVDALTMLDGTDDLRVLLGIRRWPSSHAFRRRTFSCATTSLPTTPPTWSWPRLSTVAGSVATGSVITNEASFSGALTTATPAVAATLVL